MSPIKKVMSFSALIVALIVLALAIWFVTALWTGVKSAKFLSAFEKINDAKPALTVTQVEQLMGQPLRIEHAESTGIVGDVYHYSTYPPGGDFQVVFINGVVFHTAIPAPAKS